MKILVKKVFTLFSNLGKIDNVYSSIKEVDKKLDNLTQFAQVLYFNSNIELASKTIGYKFNSQFDEDGLILSIFKVIGFTNKVGVEIACGNGRECMLANLILNFNFNALLIDGSEKNVRQANNFFKHNSLVFLNPPIVKQNWITRDNVNTILTEENFIGEIDFFSLDVDGNDYHILENLNVISPRLIVLEAQILIPEDKSFTIPYEEDFYYKSGKYDEEFRSASILAMVKLMKKKNYRLITFNKYGFNLFFLRNDISIDFFPEIDYKLCYENYYASSRKNQFYRYANLNWEIKM